MEVKFNETKYYRMKKLETKIKDRKWIQKVYETNEWDSWIKQSEKTLQKWKIELGMED